MRQSFFLILLTFLLGNILVFSQKKTENFLVIKDTVKSKDINPLRPATAAFYSAILPGLGQAYNKKYWKIPIVYGAIGTSLYFYLDSGKKYNELRDVYKRRLEGYTDDKFPFYNNEQLISAQKFYQRNKDFSTLFVVGFYVLNIIEANVDAALLQFNVNDDLSLRPDIYLNGVTPKANIGLTLNFKF